MSPSNRLAVILVLGTTQTLGWASSFYLPAIIGDRIAQDIGISSSWFFAAFSAALVVSAMVGPTAGRWVDAVGGRSVLVVSNIIFAVGLTILALAHSDLTLWFAWLILGLGMGMGLYDTAFAALGRIYGLQARSSITGITLLAGFASTVGWPLTAWGATELGWRETCLAWAAAHIVLGLPLNLLFPTSSRVAVTSDEGGKPHIPIDRPMIILGLAFAASWMVVTAMAVHLPRLLEAAGASTVQAVTAGALIGPSQVGARLLEASLMKRFHPMVSARLSVAFHPVGAALVAVFGAAAASAHRDPARAGQRHPDHRAWNGAARNVWRGALRVSAGTSLCAKSRGHCRGTTDVRNADRQIWRRRADCLLSSGHRRVCRPLLATSQCYNSQVRDLSPIGQLRVVTSSV